MQASKYFTKIKNITDSGLLAMNGNRLLIEILSEGEKVTKSGIIAEVERKPRPGGVEGDRARAAMVLAVGPGYETDEGEVVEVGYKPGDIVLVNQFGIKTFGDFFGLADYKPDSIGLATEDLIQGRIGDFEKFNEQLKA